MRPLTATSLALALSLGGAGVVAPVASQAQIDVGIGVSAEVAPPPLPYYDQPPAPGYGYIWTPGYWAWSDYDDDYYWVPGTWVLPPRIGFLWTPPWWGWNDGAYVFNAGYWGPEVGFYGGINYGFGYTGSGYEGGYWRDHDFYYNREVNNIRNANITNVYDRPVRVAGGLNRGSFNGPGGVQARPTNAQLYAARAPHLGPTPVQQQHFQLARSQPALRASYNHGAPPIAATAHPAVLQGSGVAPAVRAGGPYHAQTGPSRAPGVAAAQRYGQGPGAGPERLNGGNRTSGNYNGAYNSAYHQAQPRYGQSPSALERFNNPSHPPGGYDNGNNAAYRPTSRAAQSYNRGYPPPPSRPAETFNSGYHPPAGYNGGYHPPPRPAESFNSGYRPPPRPAESFNGSGGSRPPPPQPAREARPAPAPQPQRDRSEPPRPN